MSYQIASRIKKFDHKQIKLPVLKLTTRHSKDTLIFLAHHFFDKMKRYLKDSFHMSCYHVNAWK